MRVQSLHLAAILAVTFGTSASASPLDDAKALFGAGQAKQVTFSDGTTQWIGIEKYVKEGGKTKLKLVFPVVKTVDGGKVVILRAPELQLDTDGASKEIRACDRGDEKTSLRRQDGSSLDANAILYFVLPNCGQHAPAACKDNPPNQQLGLQLGDLAVVITGNKIAYAIAGDTGPEKKFGEGSVALHRQLGHETVGKDTRNPTCAADRALPDETYLVVFAGSATLDEETRRPIWISNGDVESGAKALWDQLRARSALGTPSSTGMTKP